MSAIEFQFVIPRSTLLFFKELRGITWAQYIDNNYALWLPQEYNVPGFTPGRQYYLGLDQVFIII